MRTSALAGFLAALALAAPALAQSARTEADLGSVRLPVYTWRPTGCTPTGALLVFHGLGRNVAGYRDYAIVLAQPACMLVIAPEFTASSFPTWSYQRGGVVRDGKLRPAADWTVALVAPLVAWVRAQEHRPDLPYVLVGHSAGGQFLSRVAAYSDQTAQRIVIANPSTWVRPSLDIAAPYGFGSIPDGQAGLRRYLAAPVRVLLGAEDVGSQDLADDADARAQGATRLERGQNVFRDAQATARALGLPFGWTLSVVPGVGHSARSMLGSAQAAAALAP